MRVVTRCDDDSMTEPDWAHLDVIAEELARDGNPRETPFQPSQGGWWCSMARPLNPATVRRFIGEDLRLDYDEAGDVLSCRHCWASIYGAKHS